MAEQVKKAEKEPASPQSQRVAVHVPRGRPNEDPNVYISVNGINYLLPKGQTSMVPPEIAEEYYRSVAATDAFYDTFESRARDAVESARTAAGM